MGFVTVFKRSEYKYLLTTEQQQAVLTAMAPYMRLDKYGRTTIRNLYCDTDNYRLIRRSIEAPVYKEKLRIRSYGQAGMEDTVFMELKKKYQSVVYKRRLSLPQAEALAWVLEGQKPTDTQIAKEIDYFLRYYQTLTPKVFLAYDREAYYAVDGSDFRVTFDTNIRFRQENLTLDGEADGTPVLPEGSVLMEIKCSRNMPLWMVQILSEQKIRKTSFSKYGIVYKNFLYPTEKEKHYA